MRRFWRTWVLALSFAAVLVPVANGGLLGTGSAGYCDTSASQPFRAWGDFSRYVLTPGGSFESGGPSWGMAGGARIVAGNEPFYANSRSDSKSLYLPAGSSVSTPTMCFAPGDWHLRLFAVSSGSTRGLKVTVTVRSLLGVLSILDGGTVDPTGTWQPSPQLKLTLTNVTGLLTTKAVSFNFTPVGYSGSWRIDDVYLDPWVST
jgi:hypothetical protein